MKAATEKRLATARGRAVAKLNARAKRAAIQRKWAREANDKQPRRDDVEAVVHAMDTCLDYSDDEDMVERMGRLKAWLKE